MRGAEIALAAVAAACVVLAVTFRLQDPDMWQHLAVGRAIWVGHSVPVRQVWSWPTYGAIDTTTSYAWLFRALLWPVWHAAGLPGLVVWRWVTALATFVLLALAGRALGARGAAPYVVLVLAALVYRTRVQVRPETLAGVLFAATLWLLARRRREPVPGRAADVALVILVWLWANVHVSWVLGAALIGVHALVEAWPRRRPTGPRAPRLGIVLAASVAAAFLNPRGWRAVWQPFRFALEVGRDPLLRTIGELRPPEWRLELANGLPLLLAGWAALLAWRFVRRRNDPVELLLAVPFTFEALASSRFLGWWALLAAPFAARDLSEFLAARRRLPLGGASAAVAAALACALAMPLELARRDVPFGFGIAPGYDPRAAGDFIAGSGARGRIFNHFELGGFLLWRFWPDRDRLPFMDAHQSGGPGERAAYLRALAGADGWRALERRYGIQVAILKRWRARGDVLLDVLDADPDWSLVFADDAAAVYVRRSGENAALAARDGYALVPGGTAALAALGSALGDPARRSRLRGELDRMIASSPFESTALSLRATLELSQRELDAAARDLEAARRADPQVPRYYERLGTIALLRNDGRRALEFYRRQQHEERVPGLDLRIAKLHQLLGERAAAVGAYRRALRDPASAGEAGDSLEALRGR